MSFWSDTSLQPVRKRNFYVYFDGDSVSGHLVKSVSTPSVESEVGEYRLINQVVKMPTINKWSDVNIKFVDDGSILEFLVNDRFYKQTKLPDSSNPREFGRGKDKRMTMHIDVLDAEQNILHSWTLHNPFIKSINQGELSYSDDGFVEIDMVIVYDYATVQTADMIAEEMGYITEDDQGSGGPQNLP